DNGRLEPCGRSRRVSSDAAEVLIDLGSPAVASPRPPGRRRAGLAGGLVVALAIVAGAVGIWQARQLKYSARVTTESYVDADLPMREFPIFADFVDQL